MTSLESYNFDLKKWLLNDILLQYGIAVPYAQEEGVTGENLLTIIEDDHKSILKSRYDKLEEAQNVLREFSNKSFDDFCKEYIEEKTYYKKELLYTIDEYNEQLSKYQKCLDIIEKSINTPSIVENNIMYNMLNTAKNNIEKYINHIKYLIKSNDDLENEKDVKEAYNDLYSQYNKNIIRCSEEIEYCIKTHNDTVENLKAIYAAIDKIEC